MARGDIETLNFHRMSPDVLSGSRLRELHNIRKGHYYRTLGGKNRRDPEQIDTFLDRTTAASFQDPNRSKTLRGRFSRPRIVMAVDDRDRVAGYIYGANNTSSKRSGVAGVAEELVKMHMPGLLDKRYVWIREITTQDERIAGVLTALLLDDYKPKQQVSVYPYQEEVVLGAMLQQWGFAQVPGENPEPLPVFGETAKKAMQEHRVAASAGAVIAEITAEPEMQRLVDIATTRLT